MEKEPIYVVTVVYVDYKSNEVDTFVLGTSSALSIAKSILYNKRHQMIQQGYIPDNFKSSVWEWEYKHTYGIIKAQIDIVRE